MSLEDKFNAAVNVIRSLPKSGSYQPSNELMLRFYSYYKQATEGPCDKPKPGFWDVVNRAKWEAWNRLGDISREDAMQQYVNQLHKIVETMSYSENIASFLTAGEGGKSGFPSSDLELVAGDVLARVRSEHNSPADSRASSPIARPMRSATSSIRHRHDSEDEYIDTIDSDPEPTSQDSSLPRLSNGHAHQITSQLTHLKVLEELPGTLARLERDVAALRKAVEGDRKMLENRDVWRWPWQDLSVPTMAFVVMWPFIAVRIANFIERRRR